MWEGSGWDRSRHFEPPAAGTGSGIRQGARAPQLAPLAVLAPQCQHTGAHRQGSVGEARPRQIHYQSIQVGSEDGRAAAGGVVHEVVWGARAIAVVTPRNVHRPVVAGAAADDDRGAGAGILVAGSQK